MSDRALARVERVASISPIPGADRIELAHVLGWQCVVKKGDFIPGDLCIYFEVDSVLPPTEPFEFMKDRKYRVRTIKLRGHVSQGLAMPLCDFPMLRNLKEGQDVTQALGVRHFEDVQAERLGPNRTQRKQKSGLRPKGFPWFIPKTDETRVQNCPRLLHEHAGETWYATEKLDGSSFTAFYVDDAVGWRCVKPKWYEHGIVAKVLSWLGVERKKRGFFGVCSRNLLLSTDDTNVLRSKFLAKAEELRLSETLPGLCRDLGQNLAIQGELVGEGIQGNKYGLKGNLLYLFSVYNIDYRQYLDVDDLHDVAGALGIPTVPYLYSFELPDDVSEIVEDSIGFSKLNPKVKREGIVCRPVIGQDGIHGHLSFKAINPEFLLKYDNEEWDRKACEDANATMDTATPG